MTARHCTACGGALEPGSRNGRVCTKCVRPHWENPVPCAGALVERDGTVMLTRRARDPHKGMWDIPGGFMDAGESAEDAVRRELLEETGLTVEPVAFLGSWPDTYADPSGTRATLNLYYVCRVVSGDARAADDVTEIAWFARDTLPDAIAFAHARAVLEAWRARTDSLG